MAKLSLRMQEAFDNLKAYGKFQLEELSDWNFWRPANSVTGKHIRTDTMKALQKKGLVKTYTVVEGKRRIWYADYDRTGNDGCLVWLN